MTPPPNVEVTEAGLSAFRPSDLIRADVGERPADRIEETYRRFEPGPAHVVHLYEPTSGQLASGATWIALRAERRGLLYGATIAALLITLMLAFFGIVTDSVVRQPSSASSLLLLAPGLVAAYLLRPGEHAMARKLLRASRLFLILAAAITFAAAAVLIALYPAPPRFNASPHVSNALELALRLLVTSPHASDALEWALRGLAAGAAVALLLLSVSVILPRPQQHDRGAQHGARD